LTVCQADYFIWRKERGETVADTNVTRISAKDSSPKKVAGSKTPKVSKQPKRAKKATTNPFFKVVFAADGYFIGAWVELRLVRWPTRRATWGLTLAVILFSAFFVVIILLLDLLFKSLFELILS
jgi:preprotein translocase SecE subunit